MLTNLFCLELVKCSEDAQCSLTYVRIKFQLLNFLCILSYSSSVLAKHMQPFPPFMFKYIFIYLSIYIYFDVSRKTISHFKTITIIYERSSISSLIQALNLVIAHKEKKKRRNCTKRKEKYDEIARCLVHGNASESSTYTQTGNFVEILLNQTEIRLYLPLSY